MTLAAAVLGYIGCKSTLKTVVAPKFIRSFQKRSEGGSSSTVSVARKSYVGAQVGFYILMCLFTAEGLDTLRTTFLFTSTVHIQTAHTHTHTHTHMPTRAHTHTHIPTCTRTHTTHASMHTHTHIQMLEMVLGICIHII